MRLAEKAFEYKVNDDQSSEQIEWKVVETAHSRENSRQPAIFTTLENELTEQYEDMSEWGSSDTTPKEIHPNSHSIEGIAALNILRRKIEAGEAVDKRNMNIINKTVSIKD